MAELSLGPTTGLCAGAILPKMFIKELKRDSDGLQKQAAVTLKLKGVHHYVIMLNSGICMGKTWFKKKKVNRKIITPFA